MQIILNADDFGKSQEVNAAICQCFRSSIIQRTTIMATESFFDEAVKLSKKYGFFDKVGLHLNLDDGVPLSKEMRNNSHFCKDGKFRDRVFLNSKYRFVLNVKDSFCVEEEITAQMTKFLEAGFPLKHFDSHHFVHNNLSIIPIACKVGRRLGFQSTRLMEIRPSDHLFKKVYKIVLNNYLKTRFNTSGQFLQSIDSFNIKKGSVEFMVHPNMINSELANIVSWCPERYESFDQYDEFVSRVKAL